MTGPVRRFRRMLPADGTDGQRFGGGHGQKLTLDGDTA